jgi:hypothetical protein
MAKAVHYAGTLVEKKKDRPEERPKSREETPIEGL